MELKSINKVLRKIGLCLVVVHDMDDGKDLTTRFRVMRWSSFLAQASRASQIDIQRD